MKTKNEVVAETLACKECVKSGRRMHKERPELSARQWAIVLHTDRRTHATEGEEAVDIVNHVSFLEMCGYAEDEGKLTPDTVKAIVSNDDWRHEDDGDAESLERFAGDIDDAIEKLQYFADDVRAHAESLRESETPTMDGIEAVAAAEAYLQTL